MNMRSQIRPALVSFLLLTVITGLLYPALVTAVAKIAFARQSAGSLIVKNGKVVGSDLIGQPFSQAKYFWSRPSATSPVPYAADNSSGSNLGPTNPQLLDAVRQRITVLRAADPENHQPIPADLVTASASGLDPDISVAAADYQIARVAKARGMSVKNVRRLVQRFTEGRTFGILGEPRVNVLKLNLALDGQ
jgi:potassium-transporting ATPase KdpC subunit